MIKLILGARADCVSDKLILRPLKVVVRGQEGRRALLDDFGGGQVRLTSGIQIAPDLPSTFLGK